MLRVATLSALLASASCFAIRIHLPATAGIGARAASSFGKTLRRGASAASGLHMSAVPSSRRAFLGSATVVAGGLLLGESAPVAAETRPPAADDVLIYVGAGCFWHVQHEMTVAEQVLLGRDGQSFTAVAGYAGGSQIGKDGKVCCRLSGVPPRAVSGLGILQGMPANSSANVQITTWRSTLTTAEWATPRWWASAFPAS